MMRWAETLRRTTVVVEWWSDAVESEVPQDAAIGGERITHAVRISLIRGRRLPSRQLDAQLLAHSDLPRPPEYFGSTPRNRIRFVLGSAFGVCITLLVQLLL
jgi:hypothetical protein